MILKSYVIYKGKLSEIVFKKGTPGNHAGLVPGGFVVS